MGLFDFGKVSRLIDDVKKTAEKLEHARQTIADLTVQAARLESALQRATSDIADVRTAMNALREDVKRLKALK